MTAQRQKHPSELSYPALLLAQNKHRFYFSTIPVDSLFESCFVARRDEDPATGFQRALNESRADDIARYLADGAGSIPSNIVLSAQAPAAFRYERKSKSIFFRAVRGAFLVLDGQHRLWGYQKCRERHRVPVAIYEGLTRAEEARLFIDINTTQRGVPAALLLDIKQLAQMESRKEQVLRDLFDKLNQDPESPLAGRLSAARSTAGRISRVTFNRAMDAVLTSNIMSDTDPDGRYRLVRNYLNAFEAEMPDKRLLVRASFFEAIMEVFDAIVQSAVDQHRAARKETISKIIAPLARLDYFGSGGRTLLEKKEIVQLMRATLRVKTPISTEML
ncbi:MAG: DGQHR domain-containing protein [Thermoanaerobaculia bacterium]|nr:DGQHR domain-containing protein [Thermoanaerobaculia bacterium]